MNITIPILPIKKERCKHEWKYKEFKVNFGVTWAEIRHCKKCGAEEYKNYSSGYYETPWIRKEIP